MERITEKESDQINEAVSYALINQITYTLEGFELNDNNIGNWCLYNQNGVDTTSFIRRHQKGYTDTAFNLSDQEIKLVHQYFDISENDVIDIICSSMFGVVK